MDNEGYLTMNTKELHRLEILGRVRERRLTQADAAAQLGLGVRQVERLCRALRDRVVELVRSGYRDFGPTLAAEKLRERDDILVSVETLRRWMIDAALWVPRTAHSRRVYQPRHRRACVGELIQIDGSDHAWFEDRGPTCTLLVYVDDATSQLMELRFVASESTFDYFASTQTYLARYGKPVAFYSDRASIFRVTGAARRGAGRVAPRSSAGPWRTSTSTSCVRTRPRPRAASSGRT